MKLLPVIGCQGEIDIAQLIKLRDYVTRYERDIYRYPTQFIRLKQEQWDHLREKWLSQQEAEAAASGYEEEKKNVSIVNRWKTSIFRPKDAETEEIPAAGCALPAAEKELTQHFLHQLFPFQLKWASSTVSEVSIMNQRDEKDELLRYFLQRFPDTYLVMYHPVFLVQQAPVEAEMILISPLGAEIIYMVEEDADAVITASDERTWEILNGDRKTTRLSPLIALKRTEQIVRSIFRKHEIDFPVTKTVLSRTNEIRFSTEPFRTSIVGRKQYKSWFEAKRNVYSPLKNRQLKAAEALLTHASTTAVTRPEWLKETEQGNEKGG